MKTILILDDDRMMLLLITRCLKAKGYQVISADDALQALNIFEREKIDLVISDLVMPVVSGLNLVSMLRGLYLSKVPVLMISGYTQQEMIDSAMKLGANDFISKPINPQVLLEKVEKLLNVELTNLQGQA